MPPENVFTHLILGVLTGLPAVLLAIATLVQVLRQRGQVQRLHYRVNGRLDELLAAREELGRLKAREAPGRVGGYEPPDSQDGGSDCPPRLPAS